jgi:hypothetical protein
MRITDATTTLLYMCLIGTGNFEPLRAPLGLISILLLNYTQPALQIVASKHPSLEPQLHRCATEYQGS